MIDYAVVLLNGKAYKSSNFGGISAIQFTKDGKVYGFTYKHVKYYAIFKFSTKYFLDYAEEGKFNALIVREKARKLGHYTGVDVGLWKNEKVPSLDITFKSYNELEEAAYNSDIYGVLRDRSGRCFNWFTWKYLNPYSGPVDPELAPGFTDQEAFLCDKFESNPAALKFYEDFKDQKFYDLTTGKAETDARLIGEIAALMMKVDEQMTIAFNKFASAQANAGEFKFFKNTDGNYIKEQLVNYKNGFERWIQIYYEYQDKLKKLDDISQYYIIYDLYGKYNMLEKVDVLQKIKILKHFCDAGLGSLSDWYFGSWKEGLQHHESLVVAIVKSVTKEQAPEFLEGLISTKVQHRLLKNLGAQTQVTLYKRLFYLIDDALLGPKNFTEFVEALRDIVLLKNGIDPKVERPKIRTIQELQSMADTQFFFGTYKEKNRIDHYVVSTTDRTIEFKEEYWLETKLETRALSSGTGHVVRLYDEVGLKKMTSPSKVLGHFDLVSVHFFEEPSFVDRTTDPTYVGQHFLTFAGFVDYLKEKEHTQDLIDLMNKTLFVISLAFGFGELLIAVRAASMIRTFVGAAMIAGDTSVFLTANIPFRNYLKDRYPDDHDDILGAMVIGGTLASLGASTVANSRILNAYSKKEAVEFLETAEFFLKETAAVSKLTPNEIGRLKVGSERFDNAMFSIRYEPEVITIARRTKGMLKFHDSVALKAELMLLSEPSRLRFLSDFADITKENLAFLKANPETVGVWNTTEEIGKIQIMDDTGSWLRSHYSRELLKNKDYDKIAQIYNRPITLGYEAKKLPGVRWLTQGEVDDDALIAAFKISNDPSDIAIIAANYNFPLHMMETVKHHYWVQEHFILASDGTFKIGRFEKIGAYIEEWNDAIGDLLILDQKETFIKAMVHEYIEAKLMEKGMNFKSFGRFDRMTAADFGAHELSPIITVTEDQPDIYNYLHRSLPPPPDLVNFSNLDEIVEFYVNAYKLK